MHLRNLSLLIVLIATGLALRTQSVRTALPATRGRALSRQISPLRCSPGETNTKKKDKEKNSSDVVLSPDLLLVEATNYREEALSLLASSTDSKEVENMRVLFLGKNGKITGLLKSMRLLSNEDKPKLGEIVNEAKSTIEVAIESAMERLKEKELQGEIAKDDIGNAWQIPSIPYFFDKTGTRHPLGLTMDLAVRIFEEIGYEAVDGPTDSPHIENDFYNFEALGMPPSHPARDMQDTFYLDTGTDEVLLLRTHTSAVQIREMEKRTPPFKIVCPGRVFRKDDVDATHYPCFHQVEILAIDEIGKLTVPHLLGTVKHFLRKMFGPDVDVKFRASYFPFTEPSM
jgi:phenylalanyl-tRNA synthetase alpha chain